MSLPVRPNIRSRVKNSVNFKKMIVGFESIENLNDDVGNKLNEENIPGKTCIFR